MVEAVFKFDSLLAPVTLIVISIVAIIVMIVNIVSVHKCSQNAPDLASNNAWIIGINVIVILASIVTLIIGIYAAARATNAPKVIGDVMGRARYEGIRFGTREVPTMQA